MHSRKCLASCLYNRNLNQQTISHILTIFSFLSSYQKSHRKDIRLFCKGDGMEMVRRWEGDGKGDGKGDSKKLERMGRRWAGYVKEMGRRWEGYGKEMGRRCKEDGKDMERR